MGCIGEVQHFQYTPKVSLLDWIGLDPRSDPFHPGNIQLNPLDSSSQCGNPKSKVDACFQLYMLTVNRVLACFTHIVLDNRQKVGRFSWIHPIWTGSNRFLHLIHSIQIC